MSKTPVIIITGYPGAGKTTMARQLSEKFALPLICKDEIKEILFDSLGWKDLEWSRKLGSASYELMFFFARKLLELGKPFILETYFSRESEKEIDFIQKTYNAKLIQIVCQAEPAVLLSRVKDRLEKGQRHPGHADKHRFQELEKLAEEPYKPLDVKSEVLIVDTTDFAQVNTSIIEEFISQSLQDENSDLLNAAIKFVDYSFGLKKDHYERTLFWVNQLDTKADLGLRIAAYCHDIERAFGQKTGRKRLMYDTQKELRNHQEESARIIYNFLLSIGADKKLAEEVRTLVSHHEIGGTEKQNTLMEADSISYLENNAPRNLEWLGIVPAKEIRTKYNWMYERIKSPEAKKIAKPLYENAVQLLEQQTGKIRHS